MKVAFSNPVRVNTATHQPDTAAYAAQIVGELVGLGCREHQAFLLLLTGSSGMICNTPAKRRYRTKIYRSHLRCSRMTIFERCCKTANRLADMSRVRAPRKPHRAFWRRYSVPSGLVELMKDKGTK